MFSSATKSIACFVALLGLSNALVQRKDTIPETYPAFDGTYQETPVPGPTNNATDWWYFQAVGDTPPAGIVPHVEVTFFTGYAFTLPAGIPHYLFAVSGVLPNGTTFNKNVFVPNAPEINIEGQAVTATWGNGLAGFSLNNDLSQIVVNFNDVADGIVGNITLDRVGPPPLTPGNGTIGGSPYFDNLITNQVLNSYQETLFRKSGWVIPFASAKASVNLQVGDYKFVMAAKGYQDKNWSNVAFDQFINTWLVTLGTCGPFSLKFFEGQAKDTARGLDIVHGGLTYTDTHGTTILQNQNYLFNDPTVNSYVNVTLTGQTVSAGLNLPTGQVLEFTLANGQKYKFTFHNSIENPAQPVYHRWGFRGEGGLVGGPTYKCNVIGEWLNPGLVTYTEGVSPFDVYEA